MISETAIQPPGASAGALDVSLDQLHDFVFVVDFHTDGVPALRTDEPPPLGHNAGPSPTQLLAAAVANCLASSLYFCLRKARAEVAGVRATVHASVTRNPMGRLRIERMDVTLDPRVPDNQRERLERCRGLFEDFCTVTESVRAGLDVRVAVAGVD